MSPADIAALLYAVAALGEFAARTLQQLRGGAVSDEEFEKAWAAMRGRLADANVRWQQATAHHQTKPQPVQGHSTPPAA